MSWQLVDAPSHVAPETGPNLLVGAGPWTVPLVLDGEYVLTVEVLGGGVVEWSVTGVDGEGLPVAVPGLSETVTDTEWVRVTIPFTAPAFTGDATVTLTVPGESRNPELGELTGRTILTVPGDVLAETIMASGGIIAGVEGGARVELNDTGLHAYDGTGVETARIQGEGGEFVGGEFRTSDNLPGQVVIADDAVDNDFDGGTIGPGIRVTPTDASDMVYPASIGPTTHGLTIYGGRRTTGGRSIVQCNPGASFLRTFREDGATGGEVQTSPNESFLRTYREDGTIGGEVQTSPTNSFMRTRRADGTSYTLGSQYGEVSMRRVNSDGVETAAMFVTDSNLGMVRGVPGDGANFGFKVDANGVWVARYGPASAGGGSYNLLETASDSGWQSITLDSGFSGSASLAWRNKGGVIWFRGTVTGSWSGGSYDTVATLPPGVRPAYAYTVNEAGSAAGVLIRVQSDGRLEIQTPSAGTSTHRLTSLSYPIG